MYLCSICGSKFTEEKRLNVHQKTHEKSKRKDKRNKISNKPDFEKPDFSHVM